VALSDGAAAALIFVSTLREKSGKEELQEEFMRRVIWVSIAMFVLVGIAFAFGVPKDLKEKLEARYKHQKLRVVPAGVIVGLYKEEFLLSDSHFNVHYDHFAQGVEMPAKYEKRDAFDDRTTQEVQAEAGSIDHTQSGETVECRGIRVIKRATGAYAVDLLLKAISASRLATKTEVSRAGNVYSDKVPYGVHFRFLFSPDTIESSNYDAVVREIGSYLLPESEYKEAVSAAAKVQEGPKNIDIQPGMSRDDVVKLLGEPLKTVTFGKKTIMKYKDVTIELEDAKVTDVKTN
jgi:hypothetical protein